MYYIVGKTFELNNLAIAFTAAKMSTTSSSSSLGNAGRKTSAALGVKQSTRKLSARMNSEVADAFRLFDKVRIFFWLFVYIVHCNCMYIIDRQILIFTNVKGTLEDSLYITHR